MDRIPQTSGLSDSGSEHDALNQVSRRLRPGRNQGLEKIERFAVQIGPSAVKTPSDPKGDREG